MMSVPVKLSVLLELAAEESIVPLLAPRLKRRLVVAAVLLLYCSVPPLRTRSVTKVVAEPWPRLLAVFAAANVPTFRMPPEIVVGPV